MVSMNKPASHQITDTHPQARTVYLVRYAAARNALLAAGNPDDYDLHEAAQKYGNDFRSTFRSVARKYDLIQP